MKRFTLGITTHNEESTIEALLTDLSMLSPDEVDIILFDDCSTDRTRDVVSAHAIATQANFRAHFAPVNNGTPSVGRAFIGAHARTEYVVLVDGDDSLNVAELRKFIATAPSGYDMLISPYALRGAVQRLNAPSGQIAVDYDTVTRILSGIGGKAYRTELLARLGEDPIKGRSDDVRLNIRILLHVRPRIHHDADTCFYIVHETRKSARLSEINFDELRIRLQRIEEIRQVYGVDGSYPSILKRNIRKIISADTAISPAERHRLEALCADIFKVELKRIVFIVQDISQIGGIPSRLRKVLRNSAGRRVAYVCLSDSEAGGTLREDVVYARPDAAALSEAITAWRASGTVVVTHNNLLARFPPETRRALERFPLVHLHSGQMAFFINNTSDIYKKQVEEYRATAIISLSDGDINFQRQLGIHGQIKGFLPVEVRASNTYDMARNRFLGYVGRMDFPAKGCERLLDVARALRDAGLPPIRIFTTAGKNSPDYQRFLEMVASEGLSGQFVITLECTDPEIIYSDIRMLLLPSKKEGFGNVILEANSFGIPVISTTYAPGPADLIEHGRTGYLLDDFTGSEVLRLVGATTGDTLAAMSAAAFEKHKAYSMEAHLDFLEEVAGDALNRFAGRNELRVFPDLRISGEIETLRQELAEARQQLDALSGGEAERPKRRKPVPTVQRLARLARKIGELELQLRQSQPDPGRPPAPRGRNGTGSKA